MPRDVQRGSSPISQRSPSSIESSGGLPASALRILGDISPLARHLPKPETDALNEVIDRLMNVLLSPGHSTSEQGDANADHSTPASFIRSSLESISEDVEAQIDRNPENFGRIIDSILTPADGQGLASIQETASTGSSWETISTGPQRAIARDGNSSSNLARKEATLTDPLSETTPVTVIRRKSQRRPRTPKCHVGRIVFIMQQGNLKSFPISPIPLDYRKIAPPRTPSVDSDDSELDCSSPCFSKSYRAELKKAYISAPAFDFERGRDRRTPGVHLTKSPTSSLNNKNLSHSRRKMPVFNDIEPKAPGDLPSQATAPAADILRDTTNLPQAKYLQYNSFARDKVEFRKNNRKERYGKHSPLIPPGVKILESSAAEQAGSRHPQHTGQSKVTARSPITPARRSPLIDDRERISAQAHALVRLEGIARPCSPSPIKRYANLRGVFGTDVQVEHRSVRRREPSPLVPFEPGSIARHLEDIIAR